MSSFTTVRASSDNIDVVASSPAPAKFSAQSTEAEAMPNKGRYSKIDTASTVEVSKNRDLATTARLCLKHCREDTGLLQTF